MLAPYFFAATDPIDGGDHALSRCANIIVPIGMTNSSSSLNTIPEEFLLRFGWLTMTVFRAPESDRGASFVYFTRFPKRCKRRLRRYLTEPQPRLEQKRLALIQFVLPLRPSLRRIADDLDDAGLDDLDGAADAGRAAPCLPRIVGARPVQPAPLRRPAPPRRREQRVAFRVHDYSQFRIAVVQPFRGVRDSPRQSVEPGSP